MKNKMNFKHGGLLLLLICFASLSAVPMSGCAGKTKTSTVTTRTADGVGSSSSVTTQSDVTTDAHPRGVIGGLFYTIGQVLIWPFRVIGSLF